MASRQDVINWVSRAWESVTAEVICRSFVVTGISSALDGSDDHQLTDRMADALNAADRADVARGDGIQFNEEGSDSELDFEGFPDDE